MTSEQTHPSNKIAARLSLSTPMQKDKGSLYFSLHDRRKRRNKHQAGIQHITVSSATHRDMWDCGLYHKTCTTSIRMIVYLINYMTDCAYCMNADYYCIGD